MTRRTIFLLLAILAADISASAQFSIGLRDNRFVNVAYKLHGTWDFKLEHSIFSEKPGYQYIRAYAGYGRAFGIVRLQATPYFGTTYNGSFYNLGAKAEGKVAIGSRVNVSAAANPHYDSQTGFKMCFSAGASVGIIKELGIFAGYSTIPEYRISEERIRAGLMFRVKGLWAAPSLSIPAKGPFKQFRVLTSLGYTF